MAYRLSVGFLLVALVVLAILQYQWIGQISAAERQRLERSVRDASDRFAGDFSGIIRQFVSTFEVRDARMLEATLEARYRDWQRTNTYPQLLKALYIVRSNSSGSVDWFRLDAQQELFEPVDLPPEFQILSESFTRGQPQGPPDRRSFGPPRGPASRLEGVTAFLMPVRGNPDSQRGPGPGPGFGPPIGQGLFRPPMESWVLIELNDDVLAHEVFPGLVTRHFPSLEGQNYRVAVVSMNPNSPPLFTMGGTWSDADLVSPDNSIALPGQPVAPGAPGPPSRRGGPPRGEPGQRQFGGPGPASPAEFVGQGWRLLVKNEAGSLELAVSRLRTRNLAISFGILVVLGLGAATALLSSQRAHRLGKLQVEFAAGVSHELRTPLAVIQSAAHNLRAGIVSDKQGIEEYAAIVQKEARRLSDMVEQVMAYAEMQSGRKRYDVAPADLNDMVDRALHNMTTPLRDAGAVVEKRLAADLPPVMADAGAFTQCIQNLLSNAMKYGRDKDSLKIEIDASTDLAAQTVALTVRDYGSGVPESDVRSLFEAFHRGSNTATNTPGNGLGLHLVQQIMAPLKGNVRYQASPGGGASFTLTLPIANISV